jgi:Carboxypeptidase regulatory-like domain
MVRRMLVLTALVAAAACGDNNPVAPSDGGAGPGPVSLVITGATSLDHPGDTTQLTATLRRSDGTTEDVTARAAWQVGSSPFRVCSVAGGVITALEYGIVSITASFGSSQARVDVRVLPEGMHLVQGAVTDEGVLPLPGATVEVRLPSEERIRTITNESGYFALPGAGDVELRVERDGYRSNVKRVMIARDDWINVEMRRVVTHDISGAYTLTFTAAPSCTLPAEVRTRQYVANIFERDRQLFVKVTGGDFVAWGGEVGFTGTIDGTAVHFVIRNTFDDDYNLIERIGSADLYYSGNATGEFTHNRIVAAFCGTMRYAGAPGAGCTADHSMELERR